MAASSRAANEGDSYDPLSKLDATSAATVVVTAMRGLVIGLNGADPAVRAARAIQGSDAVHDMRRITRQLRSLLATYRSLFAHAPVAQLRAELQWLGRMLGVARDVEVRRSRAARELQLIPIDDESAWIRLVDADRRDYAAALATLRQVLDGRRYARLLDGLDEFVAHPPLRKRACRPADTVLVAAVRKQVTVAHATADAAQASDSDREAALHEARKALRRLRYSISVLADASSAGKKGRYWHPSKKLRRIAATAKPVVSALGAHRDRLLFSEHVMVVARQARAVSEDTFVYGLIIGRLSERTRAGHDTLLVELRSAVRRIAKLSRDA
ncbi:CHAD domain-containing protein [Leifsonia sp. A12D58]|uniref:CHAD domain-containing protein n=1 Tax=Leifsonia sp. A12D58 TaxID=3397674 RepID=UPI0039E108DA